MRLSWSLKCQAPLHILYVPVSNPDTFRGFPHTLHCNAEVHPDRFFDTPLNLPFTNQIIKPFPVVARSKAYAYGRSPAGILGSNPTGGHGYLCVESFVCCQVEVSVTG